MAKISGDQMTWHKVTLDFEAPQNFSENPDTFRDYRLDVTFTNAATGEVITVPGFFAADGDAANTGATSGNVWRAHFNPPSEGDWTYTASFRTGDDIAAKTFAEAPNAGQAVEFINGDSGTVSIAPTDKTGEDFRAKGMIVQDEGTHFLQHQGDGDYFVRGGPGIPENFLANKDFDNTGNGRHDYSTHLKDYNGDGETWDGGKGAAILGAVNYLAENGQNTIYMLTNTSGGDGQDVSPWTFPAQNTPKFDKGISNNEIAKFSTYDVSKLEQWGLLFDHMDEKGIYKNVLLQETENDQQLDGGTNASGTTLSIERMVYMREMVARFGHNNGIQWNLGEENTNTNAQRADMAEYMKSVDGYDHLVTIHSFPNQIDQVYNPLLGVDDFDGASFQTSRTQIRDRIEEFRDKSAANGDKWVLTWDEDASGTGKLEAGDFNFDAPNQKGQRDAFWGSLTAGGSGGNWYIKDDNAFSLDQNYDDFTQHKAVWTWTAAATKFFNTYIPFWDMRQADGLTSDNDDYVMAKDGEYYVIYLPYGEAGNVQLNLNGQGGETFDVFWYNPRTGGELIPDGQVNGGGTVQIGGAPADGGKDWVLFVRNQDAAEFPGGTVPTPGPTPAPGPNAAPVAQDDTAETGQDQTIFVDVLANDSDPDGGPLTLTSVNYNGNSALVTIENGQIKVNPLSAFTNARTEVIEYTVHDAGGKTDTATLEVQIGGGGGVKPDPTPDPDPVTPPDASAGAFQGKNGAVVIEAESAIPQGSWRQTNVDGQTVLLWDAPSSNYGKVDPGEALTYNFVTDEAGNYHIGLHSGRVKSTMGQSELFENGKPRTDTGNDVYVAVIDVATGAVVQKPTKLFTGLGGSDRELRFGSTFDANHKKSPAAVQLDANKEYRLEIIGRSDGYALDMITLNKGGVLKNANLPESPVVGTKPPVDPMPPVDPNPPVDPTPNPNQAPVARDDTASTGQNNTIVVDVLGNDTDANGDTLTLTGVKYDGDTSLVSIKDGKIEVNPLSAAKNARTEVIEYTVSDGKGGTDTATLEVAIGGAAPAPKPTPKPTPPTNQAPTAVDDTANTSHNKTIVVDVLANDSDAEGGTLTLTDVAYTGDTAMVNIEDGKIKVNPLKAATNDRVETITYTVKDDKGATSSASLDVNVGGAPVTVPPAPPAPPVNKAPVAKDDVASTPQNKTIVVDVLGNDSDPEGGKLTLTDVSYDGNTSLVSIEDGKIKVNPLKAATNDRTEVITYTVTDEKGAASTATLAVDIGTGAPVTKDSILDFYLADAGTDETIQALEDGAKIDADQLSNMTTFYATTDAADVDYVRIMFEGETSIEKVSPYALFGDNAGDFKNGLDLAPGSYELQAAAFDDQNKLLDEVSIGFDLV
ncbi:Ig-like domain-containing protein [Yoonia sp. 2307UL14-13]|uniref:Ig-like domain-containing protein n=1 Tax=Yoonia sp. 2307UL14-13 TaxID=3126506 RepID=UPI0030A8E9FA